MNILIIKLGATGDVVRTTTLLENLEGSITWITADKNTPLLEGVDRDLRCLSWEKRHVVTGDAYDLAINLEDDLEVGAFLRQQNCKRVFGAYLNGNDNLVYTEDSQAWFDLSLISRFGRKEADRLKLKNRATYQELVFQGLGYTFSGEKYHLPEGRTTGLKGDVAISPVAGPVWPMKKWAYYDELKSKLESLGLKVNVLPTRATLLEHLGDVRGHRCLVSGDSLPMHLALGSGVKCVSIFTCTSPWEIYDYGIQRKVVSPLLDEYFYKRAFDVRATTSISLDEVLSAVSEQLA
jgi:heptosyltransferase-2